MSTAKYNILFFFSIFPIWIIKFNLAKSDLSIIIFIIFFLILINFFIVRLYKNNFQNIFFQIYFSLVFAWGIDNNLGIHNGIILAKKGFWTGLFNNVYFATLLLFIVISLVNFLIIKYLKYKGLVILSFFLVSISIFNLFDSTKSYKNIRYFDFSANKTQVEKIKLVLILDEMSGISSFESGTSEGKEFDELARNFSKKHNLTLYSNIYTLHGNSLASIGTSLNNNFNNFEEYNRYIQHSKNFFSEYDMIKNKLFQKFMSVSVFQNLHINYCIDIFQNIKKCDQYNPFNQSNYIKGFKNTFLSRVMSAWKINGSSISAITWRFLMEYRLIDTTFSPYGEKATFYNLLEKIKYDIESKKFDLIFAHSLVPHKPYGYNENCEYDGKFSLGNYSNKFKLKEHIKRHNVDRICTLKFLDIFFTEISKKEYFDDLEIVIFSDHGARTDLNNPESTLKNILFYKKTKSNFKEIRNKTTLQKKFSEMMFE